ncbi:MAG: FeoB-associated Cys-rich membrane protein [Paludibacteraceae bacterium]|nr:FeoB-associated Cys-rich membrane protein [Paludibacteraceae bacterium]
MWQEIIVFGILLLTAIFIGYRVWRFLRKRNRNGCNNCDLHKTCNKSARNRTDCKTNVR